MRVDLALMALFNCALCIIPYFNDEVFVSF